MKNITYHFICFVKKLDLCHRTIKNNAIVFIYNGITTYFVQTLNCAKNDIFINNIETDDFFFILQKDDFVVEEDFEVGSSNEEKNNRCIHIIVYSFINLFELYIFSFFDYHPSSMEQYI